MELFVFLQYLSLKGVSEENRRSRILERVDLSLAIEFSTGEKGEKDHGQRGEDRPGMAGESTVGKVAGPGLFFGTQECPVPSLTGLVLVLALFLFTETSLILCTLLGVRTRVFKWVLGLRSGPLVNFVVGAVTFCFC
jgi:hypothetical protein